MALREAGLPWRVSRVCLGDAFVYGFQRPLQVSFELRRSLDSSCYIWVNFPEGWL